MLRRNEIDNILARSVLIEEVLHRQPIKAVPMSCKEAKRLGATISLAKQKYPEAMGYLIVHLAGLSGMYITWIHEREFGTFYALDNGDYSKKYRESTYIDLVSLAFGEEERDSNY